MTGDKPKRFNACMKLRIDPQHYDEMDRIVTRFRIAANQAIRDNVSTIKRLPHLKEDYRDTYNAMARRIDAHIREAGCPESNWARNYACIQPIKEYVKRVKRGVVSKDGSRIRLPRYRNDATYYPTGSIALAIDDDGDLAFMIPTDRTQERQRAVVTHNLLGGKVTGGAKRWGTFKLCDSPRVRKYLSRYDGMDLGSAILFKDSRGIFYLSVSWTRDIEPSRPISYLGIDTGQAIPLVLSHITMDGTVINRWEYPAGSDLIEAGKEVAQYALKHGCCVAMEDLKGLGRISMNWQQFKPGQIVGAVERECDRNNVMFARVNPKYTSQRCSSCGAHGVREDQSHFECPSCGHTDNADYNAATNIGQRALGLWYVDRDTKAIVNTQGVHHDD